MIKNRIKLIKIVLIYIYKMTLLFIFVNLFARIFIFLNVSDGNLKYVEFIIYKIAKTPFSLVNYRGLDLYIFSFLNVLIWCNIFYLLYLIPKYIIKNKLSENTKFKYIYYFILVTSLIIFSRQVFVLFYGVEFFEFIGELFSSFMMFLFVIYTALVESFILPFFNIYYLYNKNIDFGKYQKVLIILNIIFLIRALIYSVYYLISIFDY